MDQGSAEDTAQRKSLHAMLAAAREEEESRTVTELVALLMKSKKLKTCTLAEAEGAIRAVGLDKHAARDFIAAARRVEQARRDHVRLLRAEGRLDEARPLLERALAESRAVHGDTHPDTLILITNLGTLLQDQRRLDEAQPLLEEAVAGFRAVRGDTHPDTLNSISSLGALLRDAGQLDEARPLLEEALAGNRAVHGDTHRDTLVSMLRLGILLKKMGKLDDAQLQLQVALAGLKASVGDAHPYTRRALAELTYMGPVAISE